ncbi:MAG: cytochrome c3 family protein [Acidobacteriota bacterium]
MFSHARHVTTANLECTACHGDMSKYENPPEQSMFKLGMSWCLDCHKKRQATSDCQACHP